LFRLKSQERLGCFLGLFVITPKDKSLKSEIFARLCGYIYKKRLYKVASTCYNVKVKCPPKGGQVEING